MPSPENLFLKEETFTSSEELSALYNAKRPYVAVTVGEFFDTGYYMESKGRVEHRYFAFWAESQYVICQMPPDYVEDAYYNYELHGRITLGGDDEGELLSALATDIADGYGASYREALEIISGYVIHVDGSRTAGQIAVAAGAVAALLLVAWIFVCVGNIASYTSSRAYKKLADGPDAAERVNTAISRDIDYGQFTVKRRDITVTRDWILKHEFSKFTVYRKNRLIWLYKTITRHRTNGVPSGKTYAVTLCFDDGRTISVTAKPRDVDELLASIAADVPDAICGYSDELARQFRQDRAAFRDKRPPWERGGSPPDA
jgi:hypothetical protein